MGIYPTIMEKNMETTEYYLGFRVYCHAANLIAKSKLYDESPRTQP